MSGSPVLKSCSHGVGDIGGEILEEEYHFACSWELQIYPWRRSHLLRNGGSRALSRQARFWDGGRRGGRLFLFTPQPRRLKIPEASQTPGNNEN